MPLTYLSGYTGGMGFGIKHIKRFEYVRLNVNEVLVRQGARNFNEYLIWKQTQGKVTIKLYPRATGEPTSAFSTLGRRG